MSKYIFMVFAGASSFGMLSTFVKLANRQGYSAAEISFSQALLGMIFLWVIVFGFGKKDGLQSPHQALRERWKVIFIGVAIGLTTLLYYKAVQYITASLAVVFLMQFAWIAFLLEWIFFKRKPTLGNLITMALIMAGTVMASGAMRTHYFTISTEGVIYAFASAFLYAIYIVANGNVGNNFQPLTKSATIMTGSAAGICFVNAPELFMHAHVDLNLLKWASLLSVFGTILPPVLFAIGIPKIGVGLSSMIMTAELPVAIIFAHIILGETLDLWQGVGILVMLLALLMFRCKKSVVKRKW